MMKRSMLFPAGLLLLAGSLAWAGGRPAWQTYRAAWFEVSYPPGFQVKPSLGSPTGKGYDSAFFTAPDRSVQFYVYSPQWNGAPTDIELQPARERMLSQESATQGSRKVRRASIRARDGSYLRAFEDVTDTATNTRRVFGIRYRSQDAYRRYQPAYLRFKASLRQFAD